MDRKINWGIVGLGKIARSFCSDLLLVEGARLYAVASRSPDKASQFASEFNAVKAFGGYAELLDCPEVDVVYIATPHSEHKAWAQAAMEAGKAVLCEKPMGVNAAEVRAMIETAREHKVFLMEALWSRFNPAIMEVLNRVRNGELGPIRYLRADFAFYAMDRDEQGRLLNPELAGGSLLDIGIYPLFLAYLMLGMPREVRSFSKLHTTGVEIQTAMILEYEEAMAMLYSGLNSKSYMEAEISGENGAIRLLPRWHEAQGYVMERKGEELRRDLPTLGKGYTHEIDEVNACLREGKLESGLWSHQNSLELMQLLDRVREQEEIRFPFEQ